MTKSNYCQLHLTCKDKAEASTIANTLLIKHLVACAKQVNVQSDFNWQGKIEHADEVLLIMDSREDLFDQVEAEVAKLHSYETFNLQAVPLSKISTKTEQWLRKELNV